MENNKRQYGEAWPVDPSGFVFDDDTESAQALNKAVLRDPDYAAVYPIDGDARNRIAAKALRVKLQQIVVTPRGKGTFDVRAAAVALPQGAFMTISPRRKS